MAQKNEQAVAPAYTGEPKDLPSPPSPDGSDYVLVDKEHETIVGYQEQVPKSEAEESSTKSSKSKANEDE